MTPALTEDGYCLLRGVFSHSKAEELLQQWVGTSTRYAEDPSVLGGEEKGAFAARNLLRIWPEVVEVLQAEKLKSVLLQELGENAAVVRALFFDKPPGNSWALPWHKDYMITVKEHGRQGVFTSPAVTAGVPQVKAPKELLEKMLTVRVHLDDMNDDNGPLRVVPGSHVNYAMAEDEPVEPATIHCKAGDVLLMRPLLTHASGKSKPGAGHRRILHLECAQIRQLPDGFEWRDFVAI